jgi:GAF domain-containing protein
MGKGVCGTAAATKTSQLVPNVHEFEGHIACSSLSNSEVVVPIIHNNIVFGVIDLDSNLFNNYTKNDVEILEKVANIISLLF